MASSVIWALIITSLGFLSAQQLLVRNITSNTICKTVFCNRMDKLRLLKNCVVIMGDLHVVLLEPEHDEDIQKIQFPNLIEVTGFVVFYRVKGLESIGSMFPNLSVIRGKQVVFNYALIIHDMADLKEVGLTNLVRIENGGVIIWAVPQACFIHTINWKAIAPNARHVLNPPESGSLCTTSCHCTKFTATNRCWNVKGCQKFVDDPDTKCHPECLICKNTNANTCYACRHRTHENKCVSVCPPHTLELLDIRACVSLNECKKMHGWAFNNTCVFSCPPGFRKQNNTKGNTICVPCDRCEQICRSLTLHTLRNIQDAGKCVKINGSLVINIRSLPNIMNELNTYLGQIEEVADYVAVYSTPTVTSLDFLSSLKRIKGRNLKNKSYSLLVYDMSSLQTLFTDDVVRNLKIGKGTIFIYNNPMLCVKELNKLIPRFPAEPGALDVPNGSNGYSGGCMKASVSINIEVINETSVAVNFTHIVDPHAHYSILYIRLPQGSRKVFVPETCSDTEWHAINIAEDIYNNSIIKLTSLLPASSYALCIEKYDPTKNILARSEIVKFSTPIGKPEPPFLMELVASTSEAVVLRWVDHKIYGPHIKTYELDVTLVEIYPKDIRARDHCQNKDKYFAIDMFRHATVMRPPAEYDRGCESMCGVLSTVTAGAMVEDFLDVCSSIEFGCNNVEAPPPRNSSYGKYVRSLSLTIKGSLNEFQVGGLAPFRDYRFRLRACSDQCSRSARGMVRTRMSAYADVPTLEYANANEDGYIFVKWKPPELTNGPILSYTVQVLPRLNIDESAQLIPQKWCFAGNVTNAILKSVKTDRYLVKICATSLASENACSENRRVITLTSISLWYGIIIGILIFLSSSVVTYLLKRRNRDIEYELPLLSNVMVPESEAPSVMMTDFMEF